MCPLSTRCRRLFELEPRSCVGHEGQFPAPEPSARYRFGQETFAGTRGNERDAPKAVLPVIRSSWRRGLEFVGGGLDGGGSAHRITRRRIDLRDRSEWVGPWAAGGGRTDAGGDSEAGYSGTIGSLANT
jgi:hypothetical protein